MPSCVFLEDHELVLEAVRTRLGEYYSNLVVVYEGASPEAALAVMRECEVDFVVMDLDLGDGRSPVDVVELLVETGVPIIIMSALVSAVNIRNVLAAGACAFVSKQGRFDELRQAIDAGMRGEQYMSSEIAEALLSASSVQISEQERIALVLYGSGLKMSSVARRMHVSESTVNEYIKRVRAKYAKAGSPVPTKVHLYRVAKEEGWIE